MQKVENVTKIIENTSEVFKKIWFNISKLRKTQLGLVFVLTIISSIAEVISIGSVIPFLTVLAAPEIIFEHKYAQQFITLFSLETPNDLVKPITIVFCISAILAGFMRWFLIFTQTRLSYGIGADLSILMFHKTLNAPYFIHVNRNSSSIISAITIKSQGVVDNALYPILYITSSLIIILIVTISLFLIDTFIAISLILSFFVVYLVIISLTRQKLKQNGSTISTQLSKVTKLVQESLISIRDVIISNGQSTYLNFFKDSERTLRKSQANIKIIAATPRFFVESFGMVIIALVAGYLTIEQDGLINVIPKIGALVFGAQRILPLTQQIFGNWSLLMGGRASALDALYLLEQKQINPSNDLLDSSFIFKSYYKINNLSFNYNNQEKKVLNNINLLIKKGQSIGIIGETGCGKSTLLDLLMGLQNPTSGSIFLDDLEIKDSNRYLLRKQIAQVSQTVFLIDGSVLENIAFGIPHKDIDIKRVYNSAKTAQIHETIFNWKDKYSTIVGERGLKLSGGQRQRIAIARALYKNSEILVLDEATSALDNRTEKLVIEAIRKANKNFTLIMVAHRLTTLKYCDKIIKIKNGMIVSSGSYKKVIG